MRNPFFLHSSGVCEKSTWADKFSWREPRRILFFWGREQLISFFFALLRYSGLGKCKWVIFFSLFQKSRFVLPSPASKSFLRYLFGFFLLIYVVALQFLYVASRVQQYLQLYCRLRRQHLAWKLYFHLFFFFSLSLSLSSFRVAHVSLLT